MQSHDLVSKKSLEVNNILISDKNKSILLIFFIGHNTIFFCLHCDLFGFKRLGHIPDKNTWRDLSFRVGMGNHFQAEHSMEFLVDFFQKHLDGQWYHTLQRFL